MCSIILILILDRAVVELVVVVVDTGNGTAGSLQSSSAGANAVAVAEFFDTAVVVLTINGEVIVCEIPGNSAE